MPYIEVFVDEDEVVDGLDADDLAAALLKKKGWRDALLNAMDAQGKGEAIPGDDLEQLLRDFYFNFPIEDQLRRLCIERLGVFPSHSRN